MTRPRVVLLDAPVEAKSRLRVVLEEAGFRLGRDVDALELQESQWGQSPAMAALLEQVVQAAEAQGPCIIEGEPGVDRELVARTLHGISSRGAAPFIAVKLGTLSRGAVADALFGEPGSQTPGLLHSAQGGTLYLEDVEALPDDAQRVLLELLDTGVARPDDRPAVKCDVRIVGGANLPPSPSPAASALLERLSAHRLRVPALRDRREDIPSLARKFARAAALASGLPEVSLSVAVTDALMGFDWPGNAKQLRGVIEEAVERAGTAEIRPEHLGLEKISHLLQSTAGGERQPYSTARREVIETFERRYLSELLRTTRGNLSEAARASGIDRANLRRMLKAHGLYEGQGPGSTKPAPRRGTSA